MTTQAFKYGAADAILERESKCPFRGYKQESDYVKGFLHGASIKQKTNVLPQSPASLIAE